jgi:class 3 adenylate cyclase/tetratricopeptide (TPR) repeat protein
VLTCTACGEENPDRAKFCLNCATPLGRAGPREERKVVTVLFCDLVGFTARSDRADPEDVKARLRPFHARLKREIEAFGGTLDKFIGDAALGVFGSPAAHEDDPERAVRTGHAILRAIEELNTAQPELGLAVRIGINTGEAVVAHGGAGPQIGEAVTGDVVNTASRLQGVAPVGGIVVGEATYRATKEIFFYEPHDPVSVKGKSEPLVIWVAGPPRGRLGQDLTRSHGTLYVGREAERGLLRDTFERAVRERAVQLLSVVGEPGVGKSRLVAELARDLESLPDLVTWRRGRCLPYGEGITFWALGEIVKAHAGILDSDTGEEASAKIDAVIPEAEPDRVWLRQRLAPLVGLEAPPAEREESFTAWRRFLESMAAAQPAVLVFEDLHWADPALLQFLEHVVDASEGASIVVLCTSRPELYERHPAWATERPNATTISVRPLSPEDTSRLVSGLLERVVLPPDVHSLILERSGGNPLYAEEFVRMLRDRNLLTERGLADGEEVLPFPESIQALIAARLDMVAPDGKAMLQDASVIGQVFWAGALGAMGERDVDEVTEALGQLSRKELIRLAPESTMEGETEYAFWHALVRDVAYGQMPRAIRAEKHRAAARWIEGIAADRVEDHAEILAHHYLQAMNLANACGQPDLALELEAPARRFLVAAGERALGLDVARAEQHFSKALELTPPGLPERPEVLARWADASRQAGRAAEAAAALREAVAAFLDRGDRAAAARNLNALSSVLLTMGDPGQDDVATQAVALLEAGPPGPDLAAAYAQMAGVKLVIGNHQETVDWAERAVALSAELGLDAPARALGFLGYGRATLGDPAGLKDMRDALALAIERGEGRDAAVLFNNLGVAVWAIEGPASSLEVLEEGIDFAERRGIAELASAMRAGSLDPLFDRGAWDRAVDLASDLGGLAEGSGDAADLIQVRWVIARILGLRGEFSRAAWLADWLVDAGHEMDFAEEIPACFSAAAMTYVGLGRRDRARELLAEIAGTPHVTETPSYAPRLPEMVRTAVGLGDVELAARLAEGVVPVYPYPRHAALEASAILAEARGDQEDAVALYADAASRWDEFGIVAERGFSLLGRGRCLVMLERPEAAADCLREAGEIFAKLGARPALEETEGLQARADGRSRPRPVRSSGRWLPRRR